MKKQSNKYIYNTPAEAPEAHQETQTPEAGQPAADHPEGLNLDTYEAAAHTPAAPIVEGIIINSAKGIITEADIQRYEEEYISSLYNPDMIYKNSSCFIGLLLYISKQIKFDDYIYNNQKQLDYVILNNIFLVLFLPLYNKYGFVPTVNTFCLLVNIDFTTVYRIYAGYEKKYLGNNSNIGADSIIKNWFNICEGAVADKVIQHNGIGGMFYLKARHGWSENNSIRIEHAATPAGGLSIDQLDALTAEENAPQLPGETNETNK